MQSSADDRTANPMRRPSSFLPWQQDGSCTREAMTVGLDLNHMGHLQVWKNRTAILTTSQRQHLASLHRLQRNSYLKEIGWNGDGDCGLMFPHWDIAYVPRELMHDFFSNGTAMTEICGLLHVRRRDGARGKSAFPSRGEETPPWDRNRR